MSHKSSRYIRTLFSNREGMKRTDYTNNPDGNKFLDDGILKKVGKFLNRKVVKERIDINSNSKSKKGNVNGATEKINKIILSSQKKIVIKKN